MEKIRILEIPACKMVASPCGMFGDGKLEKFDEWFSQFPRLYYPKDFLYYDHEKNGFIWLYMFSKNINVPDDFKIINFTGGLYAITTGIDGQNSSEEMDEIKTFIENNDKIEEDLSRFSMGHIITSPFGEKALGYKQMDYYIPVKIIE